MNDAMRMGVSLPSVHLPEHVDWIIANQRDLEIDDPFYSDTLDEDLATRVSEIRTALASYTGRLGIHGPTESLPLLCDDTMVKKVVQHRLRQALEFAAQIGATQMVLHSPFGCFGHPQMVHSPNTGLYKEIAAVHNLLDPIVAQAESQSCQIVLEVCSDVHTRPLIALVRSFESKSVQLSVDVGHAHVMQQFGGPAADQRIFEANDILAHVHLQDTDGLYDHHWAPGDGILCWHAVFRALQSLSHAPRLILEVSPHDVMRGHAYLSQKGHVY